MTAADLGRKCARSQHGLDLRIGGPTTADSWEVADKIETLERGMTPLRLGREPRSEQTITIRCDERRWQRLEQSQPKVVRSSGLP